MIRKLLWWCLAFFALALLGGIWAVESAGLSPRQLAPYIEGRSAGHAPWVEASGRYVAQSMLLLNRGLQAPANAYPAWAGGHRNSAATNSGRILVVGDEVAALEAIARAEPGDVITLLPGDYRFDGSSPLSLTRAGRADAPITLRANTLGEVQLVFDLLEGFHVQSPYWRFENLSIRGVCAKDDDCEHAFHITGKAHHTLIRNSRIEDFNAHIKINGSAGAFPDAGVIAGNTLSNSRVRKTDNPVTPIDLVAASDWRIEGNLIADFIKVGRDAVSYGAFVKGGGSNNKLLRNVVLCEHRLRGYAGQRVGLSLGGGGTSPSACRDQTCVVEQEGGVIAGNLIAQCSDEGIYLNRAAQSKLRNNTLLDTAGMSIRFPESSADLLGNLVDGRVLRRDNAIVREQENRSGSTALAFVGKHRVRELFENHEILDLRWRGDRPMREQADTGEDLCAVETLRSTHGATEDFGVCLNAGVKSKP